MASIYTSRNRPKNKLYSKDDYELSSNYEEEDVLSSSSPDDDDSDESHYGNEKTVLP
jgi:hypothetical protein